jgi:hypothetical protein
MQWSRKAKKYADHEKVCLGMVLKLFDRNFDSPLLVHPGYHRPLGGDRSVTGFLEK